MNGYVVFPEYFLPRSDHSEIVTIARESDITLISGLEGTEGGSARTLVNECLIRLPEWNESIFQKKQFSSVYEHPVAGDHKIHVFRRTPLGTFAVLVCSDLLEVDHIRLLSEVTPRLDCLIVCAMNPHPATFEYLVRSDAVRLYCNVVVANNCVSDTEPAAAAADGTITVAPKVNADEMISIGTEPVALGVADLGGGEPCLRCFEISIDKVNRNRPKPASGYFPVPVCRGGPTRS